MIITLLNKNNKDQSHWSLIPNQYNHTANNNQYKLHQVLHKVILTWQCGNSLQSIISTNAVN